MPVLHRYIDKEGGFVLTNLGGNVITLQLTKTGLDRLLQIGIQPGQTFARSLLLDLYRNGDAFTGGTGVTAQVPKVDTRQLVLDFPNDPTPESLFPTCGECASLNDVHFVEILARPESRVSLLCGSCRTKHLLEIDTSVPLRILNRNLVHLVLEMKAINNLDSSVINYLKLLDAEFSKYWDALLQAKTARQETLLGLEQGQNLFSQKPPGKG